MPKFRHRLTTTGIPNLEPGRYADGGNSLYVEVKPATAGRKTKGIYFIYRLSGSGRAKVSWKSIGVWPRVSLKLAREKAQEWNDAVFRGENPFATQEKIIPFSQAAAEFVVVHGKA